MRRSATYCWCRVEPAPAGQRIGNTGSSSPACWTTSPQNRRRSPQCQRRSSACTHHTTPHRIRYIITCPSCARRSHKSPDSTFVRPATAYSLCQRYSSTGTAVVRSPWLVRPPGTHSATICAIHVSASPASDAYLRRICFNSTRCTERITGTVR